MTDDGSWFPPLEDNERLPPDEFLREAAERLIASEPLRATGRYIIQTRRRIERAFAQHEFWRTALRHAEQEFLAWRGWPLSMAISKSPLVASGSPRASR